MNYFIKDDKNINKYKVTILYDELKKIRKEIIDNCSEISKKECMGAVEPLSYVNSEIRNLSKNKVETLKNTFHFTYDLYEYPYLVLLIDRLLNGDVEAITEIRNMDMTKEKDIIIDRIETTLKEIKALDSERKEQKLIELNNLIDKLRVNISQKSVYEYYYKVQSVIKINFISSILISDLVKMEEFFGISLVNIENSNKNIKKVLSIKNK